MSTAIRRPCDITDLLLRERQVSPNRQSNLSDGPLRAARVVDSRAYSQAIPQPVNPGSDHREDDHEQASAAKRSIIRFAAALLAQLRDPAVMVDAACSSLAATILACREPRSRTVDLAVLGGLRLGPAPLRWPHLSSAAAAGEWGARRVQTAAHQTGHACFTGPRRGRSWRRRPGCRRPV